MVRRGSSEETMQCRGRDDVGEIIQCRMEGAWRRFRARAGATITAAATPGVEPPCAACPGVEQEPLRSVSGSGGRGRTSDCGGQASGW